MKLVTSLIIAATLAVSSPVYAQSTKTQLCEEIGLMALNIAVARDLSSPKNDVKMGLYELKLGPGLTIPILEMVDHIYESDADPLTLGKMVFVECMVN